MHRQQEENGDLENQKCPNTCSRHHLIYRILLKLKIKYVKKIFRYLTAASMCWLHPSELYFLGTSI